MRSRSRLALQLQLATLAPSGGIATVFLNTASVESDFSILSWEKDKYRLSITDLSLEGIMHCKQYEILSLLV